MSRCFLIQYINLCEVLLIEFTVVLLQGTDITEAFESHHLAQTASLLLKHFHVRRATTPRNSPYTFHEVTSKLHSFYMRILLSR